jgi:uncharacterized protein (TIGR03435 family)
MAADANPSFEVAAIKPGDPDARGKGLGLRGHDFSAENFSVNDLIVFAYGVQVKQIVDGPPWVDKDKFDISAVPDAPGQPSEGQWRTMVQKLMADRFKLTFHHEKRELAVFVLTVGKNGLKLSKNENGVPVSGDINMRVAREGMTFAARNVTMADFVSTLQRVVVDRPVVDQTGLADKFDFQLTFAPVHRDSGAARTKAGSSEGSRRYHRHRSRRAAFTELVVWQRQSLLRGDHAPVSLPPAALPLACLRWGAEATAGPTGISASIAVSAASSTPTFAAGRLRRGGAATRHCSPRRAELVRL